MTSGRRSLAFGLVVVGSVLGIAGVDLVLPAIPELPRALGGTEAEAQFVIAAYVAGTALGLLGFGALGAIVDPRRLFVGSMALFGLLSLATGDAWSMPVMIGLRFLQGAVGAAPAVFAPVFIQQMFAARHAMRAIGLLSSLQSLMPALAPILGGFLMLQFGWRTTFTATGWLAFTVCAAVLALPGILPPIKASTKPGGYGALLRDPVYMRYGLSHAFSLGAIVAFVFGAPVLMVGSLGGSMEHFMAMQVCGVACFIIGSNMASGLSTRFGVERTILAGTVITFAGVAAKLAYGLAGGSVAWMIIPAWMVTNLGFGFRCPPGFYSAVQAAHGDESRGSALATLLFLLATTGDAAIAAPFITLGLIPLALISSIFAGLSVVILIVMPKMQREG